MTTVQVTVNLPFLLRLEGTFRFEYNDLCREEPIEILSGSSIEVSFDRYEAHEIDNSGVVALRSRVTVTAAVDATMPDESISTFAINNCREVLNRVVTAYQAATSEVVNAGLIFPLGTMDMHLFAEIFVDEEDVRDRWPVHTQSTIPVKPEQVGEFESYLRGQSGLPLPRLLLTTAAVSLEQAQYSLSILQIATALEIQITQCIVARLRVAGSIEGEVEKYERRTLGEKLSYKQPDVRSLETHFGHLDGYTKLHNYLGSDFNRLRNDVMHRGRSATREEALEATKLARLFVRFLE